MPAHSVNAPVQDAVGDGDGVEALLCLPRTCPPLFFEKCLIMRRM